jgi:hypothetical protein
VPGSAAAIAEREADQREDGARRKLAPARPLEVGEGIGLWLDEPGGQGPPQGNEGARLVPLGWCQIADVRQQRQRRRRGDVPGFWKRQRVIGVELRCDRVERRVDVDPRLAVER